MSAVHARRRAWRRTRTRAKTLQPKYLQLRHLRVLRAETDVVHNGVSRPRTRAECVGQSRPCPWVGCKHHFYLDVNPKTGSIKFNFPDLEPWDLDETCALDVADRGVHTLEEAGGFMNITRERVRQVQAAELRALKSRREEFGQ